MIKKRFIILLLLFSNLVISQTEFNIHLKSNNEFKKVTVSGINLANDYYGEFNDGVSKVKLPAKSSDQYSISVGDNSINGWFNSGKIDIYLEIQENKISITKTKSSPIYQKQVNYFKKYKEYLKNKSLDSRFIKQTILDNDQDAFILVPLNHYLKLHQNDKKALQFVEQILDNQPQSTKNHTVFKLIESRLIKLNETKSIHINQYLFINTKGEETTINNNPKYKYRVLDFWFTSCSPCIKDHKYILETPVQFSDFNAELIGISTDNNQEKWSSYLANKKINWENYRIEQSTIIKDVGIWTFPTYIVIDEYNKVLGNFSNIEDTIEFLRKL